MSKLHYGQLIRFHCDRGVKHEKQFYDGYSGKVIGFAAHIHDGTNGQIKVLVDQSDKKCFPNVSKRRDGSVVININVNEPGCILQ